jgi:hypothetical protein
MFCIMEIWFGARANSKCVPEHDLYKGEAMSGLYLISDGLSSEPLVVRPWALSKPLRLPCTEAKQGHAV